MTAISNFGWGEWPAWIDQAEREGITPACRGHDPNLFFPEATPGLHGRIRQAKTICAGCPLLRQCREWAYGQPWKVLDGIWGGTTQNERRMRQLILADEERNSTQAVDREGIAVD